MRLTSLAAIAATMLFATSCGDDSVLPEPTASNAVSVNDCGPADGPQVTLYYVKGKVPATIPPDTAYYVVRLPGSRASIGSRFFVVGTDLTSATAYRCTAGNVCSSASSGTININNSNTAGPVDATLRLYFAGGELLNLRVLAEWRPRTLLCG